MEIFNGYFFISQESPILMLLPKKDKKLRFFAQYFECFPKDMLTRKLKSVIFLLMKYCYRYF